MSRPPVDVTPELERTMLEISLRERDRPSKTVAYSRHALALGRSLPTLSVGGSSAADLLVEHEAPIALSLRERDGVLWLVPSEAVLHNGCSVRDDRALAVGDVVSFGACELTLVSFAPMVPADFATHEGELFEMVARDHGDIAARLIYADALEEAGYLVRAEYLRVEVRLLTGTDVDGDGGARDRLHRKLAAARRWRDAIGRPTMTARCLRTLGRACPVAWGAPGAPSMCWKCERAVPFPTEPRTA